MHHLESFSCVIGQHPSSLLQGNTGNRRVTLLKYQKNMGFIMPWQTRHHDNNNSVCLNHPPLRQ